MLESSLSIPSNAKRISAFAIDDIIVSLLFLVIFYSQLMTLFESFDVFDEEAIIAINLFISSKLWVVLSLKLLYHTVFIWQNGATIGKHLMKIKVIDLQTRERPTLQKSFLRALIRIPSEMLFYLGFVMAFFVPLKQAFHDKMSQCVVVDG